MIFISLFIKQLLVIYPRDYTTIDQSLSYLYMKKFIYNLSVFFSKITTKMWF